MKVTKEKNFDNYEELRGVFGELDANVNAIKSEFGVDILISDRVVKIIGEEDCVDKALNALNALGELARRQTVLPAQLRMILDGAKDGEQVDIDGILRPVAITASGKVITPKTLGQRKYVDAIEKNSVVFGVGPAGTGKTYLAVALAVYALKKRKVSKIILTRPARSE